MIMKKSKLVVVAFLVGIATQANVKSLETLQGPRGYNDRYLSSQSVSFIEAGVLYEVFLDGSFTYALPNTAQFKTRSQRNRSTNGQVNTGRRVQYTNSRRVLPGRIFIDRFGVLHSVGRTAIIYKPNGKVRRIGNVALRYQRGRLIQAGNMSIFYGRRGRVSQTLGNINRRNLTIGVCGVTPANYYGNAQYNRHNNIPVRYTGFGSNQDYYNVSWNNTDYNSVNNRQNPNGSNSQSRRY